MKRGYFWSKVKGLQTDIDRHRRKEKELQEKIDELEKEILTDPSVQIFLATYRHLLYQLQQSKAEVVSQIGK